MKRGRPMANSRHCREKVHFRKLLGTGTDCATSTLIVSGVEEGQRSKKKMVAFCYSCEKLLQTYPDVRVEV